MLDLLDNDRLVVSSDIDLSKVDNKIRNHPKVILLEGNSVDLAILQEVRKISGGGESIRPDGWSFNTLTQIIALMPVRNEAWIVERTLRTLSTFCDRIIVADQRSGDGTLEILKRFAPKVEVIENPSQTHSTRVRWQLLKAAREYGEKNFLLFTDADEILSANLIEENRLDYWLSLPPGTSISLELINLWRSPNVWRNDASVWSARWMEIGFRDDGKLQYGALDATLDHNKRIPGCQDIKPIDQVKLLHFQFVVFERMRSKQRWYRALEVVELGREHAEATNYYYRVTRDERHVRLEPIKREWTSGWQDLGIDLESFEEAPLYWYDVEVLRYFKEQGPEFFAPVDLWDVDWEQKRQLAMAQGFKDIGEAPIVDPRSAEERLYHTYLHRFFLTPPWRAPRELIQLPVRWLRQRARSLGLNRSLFTRLGRPKI
jgi:glycosyltransferase involved in cell wall biosynthesis